MLNFPLSLSPRWLRVRWILMAMAPAAGLGISTPAFASATFFQQQQTVIKGRVTDANNQPLPGVTVALKGTGTGTTTDATGNFTLRSAATSGVLEFSFIGYAKQEQAFTGASTINVSLKADEKALGEVVVVGYGTQKKVNLVGSVSAVKVDEKLASRSVSNASSALSGLVPGLAVSQSTGMAGRNGAELLIRGLGTINNANPLIVVDGMPDVDLNRINMNDIESVSILKDATSSAVYGSRAANGVILVTTKSGKGMTRTSINLNGNLAIVKPTRSSQFMADYPRSLTLEQRLQSVGTRPGDLTFKNGTIDQWMALGMIDPLRYPNTDWWDIIARDGALQNYNASVTGGNQQSNFFISVGVQDEKGLQIANDYKLYNARFNYDYKLRKNMNVGVRFNGNWSKMTYSLEDGFTDDNGSNTAGFDLQYAIAGITPYDPKTGLFGGVMAYNEDAQAYNPYTVYINNVSKLNRQEANTSVYLDWTPIKGLTGRIDYALNYNNQFRELAPIPNRAYNFQTGAFGTRIYVGDNAGISNFQASGFKTMLSGRISYETKIADNHQLSILGVYSEEYWSSRFLNASRNDRLYPTLTEINAALTNIMSTGGNSEAEGLRSYIGRVNYTAYDRYLLEANFRYDGSSKFLDGSRFGFFPSVGLGWRFTEESFIKGFTQKWLNSGKLRVSYGGLGNNSGVDRYEQLSTLDVSNYMIANNLAKGFVYRKMVNQDLSWESNNVFNLGLDLTFLDNRLSVDLDYYNRLTTGMLQGADFSNLLTGAYDAPRLNIGNLRNIGTEINMTWSDRVGDFRYSINLNAAYNRTNLEKWAGFLGKGYTFIDMPYHYLYTYLDNGIARTWQDVYNATPQGASPGDILRKDVNGDGRIDGNDKVAFPNQQRDRPTTNAGLGGSVSWKGIDVTFLITAATGRKDYWLTAYNNVNFGVTRYATSWDQWNNPWSWDNPNGIWPRLGGSGNREETTFWLDDMSYIRFKNVQVGYNLPANLLKRVGVASVRVFGSTDNIATITSFRGLDPELTGNKSNTYPLNRTFSFGFNVGL